MAHRVRLRGCCFFTAVVFQFHLLICTTSYCVQLKCQARKPRVCDECKRTKPVEEFKKTAGNEITRCLECTHPTCARGSVRHPLASNAVYDRHKIVGKWYCARNNDCKKARVKASGM